ncbi:serine/threonine-protein kinase [Pseudarthrobacter sp. N5]|uniref:serine/threonine-protein kinase n=1 Tax=Pseudarthrobacter sp. N5 TaxID=3418416 RepID=UPI003CEF588B
MSEGSFTGSAGALVADRYTIGASIGRGATASVYRARDENLGRDVALKLFSPQLGGPAGPGRFEAEMRLVATFNHPSLVTLYDAGTDTRVPDEPRTYLTMELIHGPDLHARLRQGLLAAKHVAGIGADLASALDYVHGRGIIHRDIKPANILLADARRGTAPRPKLTDFGIARIIEGTRLTATGTTVGTAAYLSPEQATGSALGPESDIYSLGLVLLECLTGTLEYPGTAAESAVARLHRRPRVPAALGPQWTDLLTAMTETEPSARPTARDVEAALRAAIASGSPAAVSGKPGVTTRTLPGIPDRPPRNGKAAARTRILIPTLPGEDDEPTHPPAAPGDLTRRQRPKLRWPKFPRRTRWITGAGLLLAGLVIVSVSVVHAPAPASTVPKPYPSIAGPLGQHIDQLKKSITP